MKEGARSWPAPGRWTYEDYLRLPDDGRRYEVIRGHLYVTPAPVYTHQFAVTQLARLLCNRAAERDLGVLLVAPFDIRLPDGIADPVQPDLVFFLAGHEPRDGDKNFQGSPDLVIEVLSPGTSRRDRTIKLDSYRDARVPEAWPVDPRTRTIVLYGLTEDGRYAERSRGGAGALVTSDVLAGFALPVEAIFPG